MGALGIDIGSTNVKAVLVDDRGEVVGAASRPLTWDQQGDRVEQDAESLWVAVREAVAEVGAAHGGLGDVLAVGLCGQYSSIVPVDASGLPLAPMRLYLDQRGGAHCHAILGRHDDAFMTWLERHPIPPIGGGLALGHLLGFQLDEPRVHAATAAYLEPVDYVVARLTGRIAATQGSVFASQLVDNRRLGATSYDPELLAMAGVDADRLPALVTAGEVVGGVLDEVAAATGLAPSTPVITGLNDSTAAALATGATSVGRFGIAVGTTGVVLTAARELGLDADHDIVTMPAPDGYLVSAENGLGGRAVEHVLSRFVHVDDVLGAHGSDSFGGFDAALAASPPGARGVRFLPWLSGSLAPQADPTMRGGFVGVSLESERIDLVRAAAEGVAHNLRWLLAPVEAFVGSEATEVVLTGGAARSRQWVQVLADVLACPVAVVERPEVAGAAAAARWARSHVVGRDDGSELDAAAPVASRVDPDPATASVHDVAHEQFVAAFEALRPLRFGAAEPDGA